MTFLQLQERLGRRRGANTSSFQSATQARYKDALNEAHRMVLRRPGLEALRYVQETFASVSGTQSYALPTEGIERIDRIWDQTNQITLVYQPLSWFRSVDPNPQQGTSCYWVPTGFAEVHTQPSDASSIFAKSTAAGDTTQTIYVEGIITGGYTRSVSTTLTGTTAVNVSSAISTFERITKVYVSATCVGTVTLHEDSGAGTELARITIGKTRARYVAFLLYPTPAAAITYRFDAVRGIPDMSNDTDEPLLPVDFHDLLVDLAELKELRKQDDPQRHALLRAVTEQGLRDLQSWVVNHPAWRPMHTDPPEFSSFGAFFPAERY